MVSYEDFVDCLTAASGELEAAYQEVLKAWSPEEPPSTTLFAAFGDRIAQVFGRVGEDSNRLVFSLIEQAMASGDQRLVTAVATGLIEALVNRAIGESDARWRQIESYLGPRSLDHANAWLSV